MSSRRPPISAHDARRIAAAAYCDPRTVVRYVTDQPVMSTTAARIERALRQLGLEEGVRDAAR